MRAVWFILLMFVASIAYHVSWTVILSLIQAKAPIPYLLLYALLFIFPAALIVIMGYAMGVWRGFNAIVRLLGLSAIGLFTPWLALYPTMIGGCFLMKECF
jgi:hypothetical protein